MAVKSLGQLTLDLVTRTGGWMKGMDAAERRSKKWRRQVERDLRRVGGAAKRMGIAAVAGATAAVGGLALLTKAGLDAVDQQAKLARQLDSSIGGLRGLQLAASDAGVDTGTLNGAMERLSSRLGEAQLGTGSAAEALDRIGLSASELASMDVDQRVAAIADRVQDLGLSGAETANLLRDLGIRNTEMVNLLRQGGGAIRDARQEIEDYGLAIDGVDARAVEAANDQLARAGLVLESVQNSLAVEMAPIILEVATRFNDAAREAGGFGDVIADGMDIAVRSIANAVEGASNFLRVIDEIVLGIQKVQKFQLQAEAFGGTVNRIATGRTDDMPEAFNQLAELEADMARRQARIESGSPVADMLREFADDLVEIRQQQAERRESDELEDFGEQLNKAGKRVIDFGNALEKFTPAMNDEVQDILDRAGDGATIDDKGQIRDVWGNTLPTLQRELDAELQQQITDFENEQNLAAGLDAAAQVFIDGAMEAAKAAKDSMTSQGVDDVADGVVSTGEQDSAPIQWSSDLDGSSTSGSLADDDELKFSPLDEITKLIIEGNASRFNIEGTVNSILEKLEDRHGQGGTTGGGESLGVLTLKGDNGGEIDVQANADALRRWLADELGGAAASTSPN